MAEAMDKSIMSTPYGIEIPIDEEINMCAEDLYIEMRNVQHDFVSPETYAPCASYLPYRRYLVDWMSDVGEQCRLHNTTVHVSILLLDKIFRSKEIPRNRWQMFATACISIAAKYEEAEEHCPPIPDLLQLTKLNQTGHTSLSFRDGEVEVLMLLGWRLRAIPPLHIMNYYLAKVSHFVMILGKIENLLKKYLSM